MCMNTHDTLPDLYKRAFKDADIRGIYPTVIDETVAYRTGRAFVETRKYKTLVVGYDMRVSTPSIKKAFTEGVRDAGATVVDIGMVSSTMLYFASGSLKLPGAMITASHSPKEYNGIKLVEPGAIPLTLKTGLTKIRAIVGKGVFKAPKKRGGLKKKDIRKGYQRYVLKGVQKQKLKDIKIATDIGNGMASEIIPLLRDKLPVKFDTLFKKKDGTFPNRGSDPCLKKNQKQLQQKLRTGRYDFGIGYDGDADRIAFHDETGRYINCAAIGALIAEYLLKKLPGSGIVYTNLTSRVFEETIRAHGGVPYRARVGHAFLKRTMRTHDAIFGAEHSGHFFFKDFFFTDSTTLTLLCVLSTYSEARKKGQTFSEMMQPYSRYHQTEDTVIEVKNKKHALACAGTYIKSLKPKSIRRFDGYYVDFGDVWGAVKPSVTEFALKVMLESKTKSKATAMQKKIVTFIASVADKTR